ncbi:MAG TPA: Lrp/AsnC family transcriptional regulator [Candidatus Deferrimicrobium sp.]|nr:Lrp/AsnC family transcriptional regulator [Candidatus Deferrimicrobium sp.]
MSKNNKKNFKLDEIDRKILFFLQANSRVPYHKIGKELKIAASTVHNRVKKMINQKVIRRFAAIVDPQKLGLLVSWLGLNVDPDKLQDVSKELSKFEEIQIIGASYGDHDILVQIVCRNAKELSEFIRYKIKPVVGVKDIPVIHSSIFTEIFKIVNWVPLKEGAKMDAK